VFRLFGGANVRIILPNQCEFRANYCAVRKNNRRRRSRPGWAAAGVRSTIGSAGGSAAPAIEGGARNALFCKRMTACRRHSFPGRLKRMCRVQFKMLKYNILISGRVLPGICYRIAVAGDIRMRENSKKNRRFIGGYIN